MYINYYHSLVKGLVKRAAIYYNLKFALSDNYSYAYCLDFACHNCAVYLIYDNL